MTAEHFGSWIFVVTNHATGEAQRFGDANCIQLIDRPQLETILNRHNADYDPEFLAILDATEKQCPKCEARLVKRFAQKGANPGESFWGCTNFPRCRFVLNI